VTKNFIDTGIYNIIKLSLFYKVTFFYLFMKIISKKDDIKISYVVLVKVILHVVLIKFVIILI